MMNAHSATEFSQAELVSIHTKPGAVFRYVKRALDIAVSLMALPGFIVVCAVLLMLNPIWNRGPLFFIQARMGQRCTMFPIVKFRTMTVVQKVARSHDDPLELNRITPLGRFLRKIRVDELPQVLNVLRGEMSLIGPRPDYYEHALHYLTEVPGYKERHTVRPGISGYAQVEVGYVESVDATRKKVRADLHYIANRSLRLEFQIALRTIAIVLRGSGS